MGCKFKYSVNSFSYYQALCQTGFHIMDYIDESVTLGCSELNPWYGHFTKINNTSCELSKTEVEYLKTVLEYAKQKQITFNMITVDGDTYIYDENEDKRKRNIQNAKKWIEISNLLQAKGVRFDASLPEDTTLLEEGVLAIISAGYQNLIEYAKEKEIKIFIENHYGITSYPDHMIQILDSVPGLHYLFDSWNWHHKKVAEAWIKCLPLASEIHIKTFLIKENGEDLLINLSSLLELLKQNEFKGCYTIETMPLEFQNERKLIQDTLKSIKKYKENSDE